MLGSGASVSLSIILSFPSYEYNNAASRCRPGLFSFLRERWTTTNFTRLLQLFRGESG